MLETSTGAICPDSSLTITAVLEGLTIETNEIKYIWSTDQYGSSIDITREGIYSVVVYLGEYCKLTTEITITKDEFNFEITNLSHEHFACPVSPLTLNTEVLTGVEISQWNWSTGESSSAISVSAVDIYSLTVTNSHGCQYTDRYTTDECPTLISFTATEAVVAAGDSIEICLELVNPNDNPASVDMSFIDTQSPHFDAINATQQISFAAGETYKCFMLHPQDIDEAAPRGVLSVGTV